MFHAGRPLGFLDTLPAPLKALAAHDWNKTKVTTTFYRQNKTTKRAYMHDRTSKVKLRINRNLFFFTAYFIKKNLE